MHRGDSTSVLENQAALNGGQHHAADFARELGEAIDSTPRFVAGFLLGSVIVLALLRLGGFRFSFGVGIGGGGS